MDRVGHERINGETPSGGDYSEIFYLNEQHDLVPPEKATECRIHECKNDGTILFITYAKL